MKHKSNVDLRHVVYYNEGKVLAPKGRGYGSNKSSD